MSKRIPATITCNKCSTQFRVELYRSIWVEYSENLALIIEDRINTFTCKKCSELVKVDFPFLCTNVKKGFAVWYEPYPDIQIDKDVQEYITLLGKDSFYAKAPRISNWRDFKALVVKLDEELKIPVTKKNINVPKNTGSEYKNSPTPKTNTSIYRPISDAMSHLFLILAKEAALSSKPDPTAKSDWEKIKKWLNATNDDLTKSEEEAWKITHLSFMAEGNAPTAKLDADFEACKKLAQTENWPLIAISAEIRELMVRKFDVQEFTSLKNLADLLQSKPRSFPRINSYFINLSRHQRIFCVFAISWIAYVLFRTNNSFRFLGEYFDEWDDDSVFANALVPPTFIFVAYKVFKWIKKGKSP